MTRTMAVPCRRDLACYRNDGHPGDHAYATPDTVPSPAPIWQAGYDAGYREAQQDAALSVAPSPDALDVERLAEAVMRSEAGGLWTRGETHRTIAAAIARAYAAQSEETPR